MNQECRFPFTKAGNDGVGGHGVHESTTSIRRLMESLQNARYVLKPGRSPEYRQFLSRLLCPDVSTRYTAAEALKDPWILMGPDPWTAEHVDGLLAAMTQERIDRVPAGYTQEQWCGACT